MTVNGERVLRRLEELYACGNNGGIHSRIAFSREDMAGRRLFCGYMEQLGIQPKIDAAGNIIARLEGKNHALPAIASGSHLDTVPNGGRYDGALGCVAALEVLEVLKASNVRLEHPFEVIVFTDEEGIQFGKGLLGSSAMCGADLDSFLPTDTALDGRSRDAVFQEFGIQLSRMDAAARPPEDLHCFLELHIEQGKTLDRLKQNIGIVTTISGVKRFEITITGETNHSGSTMMADRRDALVAASAFISSIPNLVVQTGDVYSVATVGSIFIQPNSMNVIPGRCVFTLEIRDQSVKTLRLLEDELFQQLKKVCEAHGTPCSIKTISGYLPAPMHSEIQTTLMDVCQELNAAHMLMPSGAFHDSLFMTGAFPTGMIFIPSKDGISHSPKEFSTPDDIRIGCEVLLHTILKLDKSSVHNSNTPQLSDH